MGNDSYLFAPGWGQDLVVDAQGTDSVRFADLAADELLLQRSDNDLVVTHPASGGMLRIQNQFSLECGVTGALPVEQFLFADCSSWNNETIKTQGS